MVLLLQCSLIAGCGQEGSESALLSDVIAHQTGPLYTVAITGALHLGFATDIGIVNGHFAPNYPNEVRVGTMEPHRLIEITDAYDLAFFDVYLRDHPLTQLTELPSVFPEVNAASLVRERKRVPDRGQLSEALIPGPFSGPRLQRPIVGYITNRS